MIDVKQLLEEIKASPFEEIEVAAPHTGVVRFALKEPGGKVVGPSGSHLEKPGTVVAILERERNLKPVYAGIKGDLARVYAELDGAFVEAGTPLCLIRHFLTKSEAIDSILKKVLHLFYAPERAKYFFVPDIDKKIKALGVRNVKVRDGMELFIASRMKRERPVAYVGPEGQIYTVYFQYEQNVDTGQPLIGVCPESQVGLIADVVGKVQSDWEERD